MSDIIEIFQDCLIQHGKYNNRIYVMKLAKTNIPRIIEELDRLAREKGYTKIIVKVPASEKIVFLNNGYTEEGYIPGFFNGEESVHFVCKYFDEERKAPVNSDIIKKVLSTAMAKVAEPPVEIEPRYTFKTGEKCDIQDIAELYIEVFLTYPFPIHSQDYIERTMNNNVVYFLIRDNDRLAAISSSETDTSTQSVEMTDFATLSEYRGEGFALFLLERMEEEMKKRNIITAYTIARAVSYGMNVVFAKMGYTYNGTLINNTNISGNLESMNIWWKKIG